MKKTLIFAIAGLAALASCTKNETPAGLQPSPMTITLGAPAVGTKTVLSPDGYGFKQAWKEGDALSFVYSHKDFDEYQNEKFVCTEVNSDGSAVFHCDASNIATAVETGDGYTDLQITYPYSSAASESDYRPKVSFTDFDGTLASLPDYCAVNAATCINGDGTIDAVTAFRPCAVVLRFPKGLKLLEGTQNEVATIKLTGTVDNMGLVMFTSPNQTAAVTNNINGYYYSLAASMTGCTLDEDVYAVWYDFYDWGAFKLVVNVRTAGDVDHVYTLPEFDFKPGKVYELSSATLYSSNEGNPLAY